MKRVPEPRSGNSVYGSGTPLHHGDTWLESEMFCYPNGGMTRRARVRFPDGKLRVVRCGIPDTWFSIPVREVDGAGYISCQAGDNGVTEFVFNPYSRSN